MKTRASVASWSVWILAAVVLLVPGCAINIGNEVSLPQAAKMPQGGSPRYQTAIDAVYPALVRIEVVMPVFSEGREIRVQANGSGVIISPDGYVVTNHHVAGRAASLICVLSNKEEIRATRVGTDPQTDICVLKLTKRKSYPFARFGDSGKLKVGDTVLAMGSPGSLSQSVTAGVASNVDLILPSNWRRLKLDGENVGSLVKWIAHDAAIFPGNSGGPLVNLRGEVIGINELGIGLSGAIPSNLAKGVVQQIIRRGRAERSWLGVVTQPLLKSSRRKTGVLISGVIPGSPARKAGVEPGDIVLSYNGHPVAARFAEDLPVFNRLVSATPPGSAVELVVDRGGEKRTLAITTRRRERALADSVEVREWGIAARNLTEAMATGLKRGSTDGVFVSSIRPGGPCSEAKPAIRGGDVVVAVNGKPVKTVERLIAETARIAAGSKEPVRTLVAFERKNEQWLTLVKVGIKDLPDRSPEARKAWLPASFQVLTTDLAEALKLKGRAGVRLTDVFEGRSAGQAGLKVGDIITAIDGDPVRASRAEDVDVFPAMVRQRRVGQKVQLSILRDGKPTTVAVTLERSPRATREMKRCRSLELGFTVRGLSAEDRRARKLGKGVRGVVVSEVEPGSLAAVAGLRVADVLISVDGQPTTAVSALKNVMAAIGKTKPPRVVFFVKRGIYTVFIEAETPWLLKK